MIPDPNREPLSLDGLSDMDIDEGVKRLRRLREDDTSGHASGDKLLKAEGNLRNAVMRYVKCGVTPEFVVSTVKFWLGLEDR